MKTVSSTPFVKIGSVSIPQDLFLSCGEMRYKQWITLFDHEEDDEYDGDFGDNDDETPRVQFLFHIEQDNPNSIIIPSQTTFVQQTVN